MSSALAMLRILYDEGDQDTYRGVQVDAVGKKRTFFTGDPPADWKSAWRYCFELYNNNKIVDVMSSSSCDHFVMDGNKWRYIEKDGLELLVANEEEK